MTNTVNKFSEEAPFPLKKMEIFGVLTFVAATTFCQAELFGKTRSGKQDTMENFTAPLRPFYVQLRTKKDGQEKPKCGGTMIGTTHGLTAYSCVLFGEENHPMWIHFCKLLKTLKIFDNPEAKNL